MGVKPEIKLLQSPKEKPSRREGGLASADLSSVQTAEGLLGGAARGPGRRPG